MARRTAQRQFARRKSNREWAAVNSTGLVSVPVSTKVLLGTFVLSNPGIDETILRTVGLIAVVSDQVSAAESQHAAFGMIVVNDVAGALGVTAIPGPITNAEDDGWFVYQSIQQKFSFITAAGFDSNGAVQYHFDSKAKRILSEGSVVAIVIENASSSIAFEVGIGLRMLGMVRGTG